MSLDFHREHMANLIAEIARFECLYPDEFEWINSHDALRPLNPINRNKNLFLNHGDDSRKMYRNCYLVLNRVGLERYVDFIKAVIRCTSSRSIEIPGMASNLSFLSEIIRYIPEEIDMVNHLKSDSECYQKYFSKMTKEYDLESLADFFEYVKQKFIKIGHSPLDLVELDKFSFDDYKSKINRLTEVFHDAAVKIGDAIGVNVMERDIDLCYPDEKEEWKLDNGDKYDKIRWEFCVKQLHRMQWAIDRIRDMIDSQNSENICKLKETELTIKATKLLNEKGFAILEKYKALESYVLGAEEMILDD